MNEQMVTLDEVGAAVERLVGHVLASGCDGEYARTIHMAGVDLLAILRGEWDRDAAEEDPVEEDGPDVVRCPSCNQSLWEIQSVTKFACPGCYETFGDEALGGQESAY